MTEAGWTSNEPTVEGFYWHIRTDLPPHVRVPGVLEIRKLDEGLRVYEPFGLNDVWHPLSEYGGLWLGPISPTDRQQGRVEGIGECKDLVAEFIEAWLLAGMVAKLLTPEVHEAVAGLSCDLKRELQKLAQAAQQGRKST